MKNIKPKRYYLAKRNEHGSSHLEYDGKAFEKEYIYSDFYQHFDNPEDYCLIPEDKLQKIKIPKSFKPIKSAKDKYTKSYYSVYLHNGPPAYVDDSGFILQSYIGCDRITKFDAYELFLSDPGLDISDERLIYIYDLEDLDI